MLKYKNYLIAIGVLLALVIAYFIFRKPSVDKKNNISTCPASFTIHPTGIVAGLVSTTYSNVDGKYYKQTSGGFAGYSGQLAPMEITEVNFLAACKVFQTPPTTPLI